MKAGTRHPDFFVLQDEVVREKAKIIFDEILAVLNKHATDDGDQTAVAVRSVLMNLIIEAEKHWPGFAESTLERLFTWWHQEKDKQ